MSIYYDSVLQWAAEKGILAKATPASQFEKTVEEIGELARGLIEDDQAKVADAIGDVAVTLIILAELRGLTFDDCLAGAYATIANRKGSMVNGVFVKESE